MPRTAGLTLVLAMLIGFVLTDEAFAQYFGRNKVQYDQFDFKIIETEHFQIYFYPEEEEAVQDAARMAERWYARHSQTFLREFTEKKPIIFYANDADFHQTNVIGGFIGEGTGGVTEGLKQRVVMPLTGSYADTDHVLGHELVHSFQYDIAFSGTDSLRFALGLLPLWLIEGTAEYLSVGREDPHTAMWLRDAALRDDLPTIDQITRDSRYFPYRYGQAYMAYIGGKYGDSAVSKIYKLAGRVGVDSAFVYTLGITTDSLSREWETVVKETFLPQMADRTPAEEAGRKVMAKDIDSGEINIAPSISPDGNYVAFLSERDLFNINLFLADARTGEVLERLVDINSDPHFDALRFINSAGSWSPDGTRFVFVTFADGDNQLALLDVDDQTVTRRISVQGVGAMTNPAWSPDGRRIAFSGMDGGISDLYVLDIESGEVLQLTNDRFADMQPTWSPDGQTIAFATDRGTGSNDGTNFHTLEYAPMRLGLIDVATGEIEVLAPFQDALHHNPQFSPDGRSLYFISDQDGFKDIYRLSLDSGTPTRITYLKTGVSGITAQSPAMSVASQSGRMMFSVFSDGEYSVFALEPSELEGLPVEVEEGTIATAGLLPPVRAVNSGLVSNYLRDPVAGLPEPQTYESRDYSAKLKLDYVAPPTIGASVGGPFGTQVGGGVGFFFSDMLGNHNLTLVAQAQGTFKDIGGQVAYLNRSHRLNWGAAVGHIPYLTGGAWWSTEEGYPVLNQLRRRIFIDEASVVGAYPLSTVRRFEINGGFVRYGFDYEVEKNFVDPLTGAVIHRERESLDELEPDATYFFSAAAAYVGDYSLFGFTSPIQGGRYRFQVAPMVGSDQFVSVTADYRRYFNLRPLTFAVRGLHIGNYGAELNQTNDFGGAFTGQFTSLYLGYPYYQGFVRGYSFGSFETVECGISTTSSCPAMERLRGTRLALTSLELRVPLLGPGEIALLDFPYLPVEFGAFTDAGIAWTGESGPVFEFVTDANELATRTDHIPVVSTGLTTRINVLGYLVLEFYYAYPFQRPEKGAHFGFQLMPGW